MANQKNRIDAFDIAKGIGILLVVIGHSFTEGKISNFIYSFHMALFFVVSGLLISETGSMDRRRKHAVRKFLGNNLMVSYILWSVIYVVFYVVVRFAILNEVGKAEVIWAVYKTLTLYGIGVLWFLPTLLISRTVAVRVRFAFNRSAIFVVILAMISLFGLCVSPYVELLNQSGIIKILYYPASVILRSLVMTIFIGVGCLSKPYILKIRNFNRGGVCFTSGILLLAITWIVSQISTRADIHALRFGNPFLFIIAGFLGSYGILLVSVGIERINKIKDSFVFLGVNSLLIMVTHENFMIKNLLNYLFRSLGFDMTHVAPKLIVLTLLMITEIGLCLVLRDPVDRVTLSIKRKLGVDK